jgi:putative multiple sugar transport system ATP-binding protein
LLGIRGGIGQSSGAPERAARGDGTSRQPRPARISAADGPRGLKRSMMNAILEMRGITKTFPGVKALSNVNLSVKAGEIHGIVGENGAGKSTLMKVLSGVYPHGSYDGAIYFEGEERKFRDISDSEHLGIIIIHQELALVPLLSIAENIFLGNEIATNGIIDWNAAFRRTKELLKKVGLKESPQTRIDTIGVGKQQLVEIAKALSKNVKLLILDEPTASLNESDSDALLALLKEFRAQGISSILISHKLNEILKVADNITVLRDGSTVDHMDCHAERIDENRIIKSMVGRDLTDRYPERHAHRGDIIFEVKDWNVYHAVHADRHLIKNVGINVRKGEVIGIAGLMGAGRTEFAMSVFGRSYGQNISGQAMMHGKPIDVSTINKAMDAGIAYVTEDRKTFGLVLIDDIRRNVSLANLEGISKNTVVDASREIIVANKFRKDLNIRCSSVFQQTVNLSGGNQQKVVLSKWLFTGPEVLILDEPTRGIDVGAKYEIYGIINALAESGKAVILISSEMPELLGMSDRIYIMNDGRIVGEMPVEEASQEKIMHTIMKSWEG